MLSEADVSLVPATHKILVAVSGGADSMALLCWLSGLGRALVVGHIHHDLHDLRDGDCDRDARFLEQFCQEHNFDLQLSRLQLPRRAGHVNEDVARRGRYLALEQMARETSCGLIATGHTATDALETLFLNLMRGSTLRGLGAFSPGRTLGGGTRLVRPFWKVPRQAPRRFLESQGWPWLEDSSNNDARFRRNRVRHGVLPLLAEAAEKPVDQVALSYAGSAALLRDELEWADLCAREALTACILKREEDLLVLSAERVMALHVAQQRRVLRLAAGELVPKGAEPGSQAVARVQDAVTQHQKRQVWQWSSMLRVEWTGVNAGNRIRFMRVKTEEI